MVLEDDIIIIRDLIKTYYKNYENIKYYKAIPNRNKFIIEKKQLKL